MLQVPLLRLRLVPRLVHLLMVRDRLQVGLLHVLLVWLVLVVELLRSLAVLVERAGGHLLSQALFVWLYQDLRLFEVWFQLLDRFRVVLDGIW